MCRVRGPVAALCEKKLREKNCANNCAQPTRQARGAWVFYLQSGGVVSPMQAHKLLLRHRPRPKHAPTDEVAIWGLTGLILHTFLFGVLGVGSSDVASDAADVIERDGTEWRHSQ